MTSCVWTQKYVSLDSPLLYTCKNESQMSLRGWVQSMNEYNYQRQVVAYLGRDGVYAGQCVEFHLMLA